MAKKEFKDLPSALAQIEVLNGVIITKSNEIKELKKQVTDAQKIAEDAVKAANESANQIPGEVTAKIGNTTYVVNFGIDGLTKAQLAENPDRIKGLAKNGSKAITKKEA